MTVVAATMTSTTVMTTTTTTTVMTTIEEGTHLQLKTERMAIDSDEVVWRDGRTYGWTYKRTDTGFYKNEMDACKK